MFQSYNDVENAMNHLVEDEFINGMFPRTLKVVNTPCQQSNISLFIMGAIADGLRHPNYNRTPLNLIFWDVHANEHEPHHYQLCKGILIQHTSQCELETMYNVGVHIANSEALMYKQLHEEMLQITAQV